MKSEDNKKELNDEVFDLLSKNVDDLVFGYTNRENDYSPAKYYSSVKWYWILGIIFSLVSSGFMAVSFLNVISKNEENPMLFKRVDGVEVRESMDIRRDILMKNSLRQVEIKNQENNDG